MTADGALGTTAGITTVESGATLDFQNVNYATAEPVTPPQKMFWGDYFGALKDPFGVAWGMNQRGE